jgi:putative aminopeptidase FrvX
VAHFKEEESKTGATYRLTLAEPAPTGADFAVWDLPGPTCSKRTPADQEQWDKLLKKTKAPLARPGDALFIAPACDDLIEVSTMIALLRHLAKSRAKACVHFLFTRCEETGFYGALAALESKMPLPKVTTISLEISNSVGFATVGGGPILRVGDRVSVFDSTITQWLSDSFQARPSAAGASAGAGGDLPFTRKLMAGGACEGSVFHLAGIPTGALCLPMFNYHNMGADNQIQSEMVSLMDWQSLYTGLLYLATEASSIAQSIERLKTKFAGYRVQALAALG